MSSTQLSKSISVVIPTLNEQDGIKITIDSIPKDKLAELGYDLEILVIDGNSTDLTRKIANAMGSKIILEKRRGYGRAYKTGFSEAKGDIIVTLDADGTYPAELIPEYIRYLNEKKLDFITVNRFSKMEDNSMHISHRIGNKVLSLVASLLYSIKVKDSQSGMWIMSKTFADAINLISDDFSFSEEIKIVAFRFFKAIELEGKYYKRTGKQKLATFNDGWTNLKYLFQFRSLVKFAVKSTDENISESPVIKNS